MIALDTNVLLRLLVEDDPEQVALARRLMERCQASGDRVLITLTVICEALWVLKRSYRVPREELDLVLTELLRDDRFAVEHEDEVWAALRRFRAGQADFPDYLIGQRSLVLGAPSTFTFDRKLTREDGFTHLSDATP